MEKSGVPLQNLETANKLSETVCFIVVIRENSSFRTSTNSQNGLNTINIVITDKAGNKIAKTTTVIYKL